MFQHRNLMDLGTLRAKFSCIVRPTVGGCSLLLLALVLIMCLHSNESLLQSATGKLMLQKLPEVVSKLSEPSRPDEIEQTVVIGYKEEEVVKSDMYLTKHEGDGEVAAILSRQGPKAQPDLAGSKTDEDEEASTASDRKDKAGADTAKRKEAVNASTQLPWVDEAVPYQWAQCGKEGHEQGKGICIYGPGASEAKVMQPTYFYLDMLKWKDNCYARMTGPAIFVVRMSFEGLHCLRGDYIAHEPGEYQLWISCNVSHGNGTIRAVPPNSKVYPWHHHELIDGSPFPVAVLPNEKVAPRGCTPCTGPDVGTLAGQWVSRERVSEQCGEQALGAVQEWHRDEHVWLPRECTLPFFSREEFRTQFAGAELLLLGDSTVRGTFCDLQNWLHFENGPDFYAGEFEMRDNGSSSWDYRSCGYNDLQPVSKNFAVVRPNPFVVGDIRIRYIEAREPETFVTAVAAIWEHVDSEPGRSYRAVLANFGLWWWHRYSPVCAPSSLVRLLIDHLRCQRDSPLPIPLEDGIDPFNCNWRSALRNLGLIVTTEETANSQEGWTLEEVVKSKCIRPFPGRVVYRSITGKFDDHNMCTNGYEHVFDVGEVCAQKVETDRMLRESYGPAASWDRNPVFMDVFDMVYARPDRSLDSFHFFSHKCIEKPCGALTWQYERCCYLGNVVPWSGSMAMTNLFLHQLAGDPLLFSAHVAHPDGD